MTDHAVMAIANPIMDNLMDASSAIDHERNVSAFTERAKSIVTAEHFRHLCEEYQREKGDFARRSSSQYSSGPAQPPSCGGRRSRKRPASFLRK